MADILIIMGFNFDMRYLLAYECQEKILVCQKSSRLVKINHILNTLETSSILRPMSIGVPLMFPDLVTTVCKKLVGCYIYKMDARFTLLLKRHIQRWNGVVERSFN